MAGRESFNNYYASNYNRLFNNPKFVSTLITITQKKLRRQIYKNEITKIIEILKGVKPSFFEGGKLNQKIDILSNHITKELSKNSCEEDLIDVKEFLKTQMDSEGKNGSSNVFRQPIQNTLDITTTIDITDQITTSFTNQVDVVSLLGKKNFDDFKSLFSFGGENTEYNYLILDSRYRSLSNDGINNISWNVINNEITSQGSVNYLGDIVNIVAIRFYPFRIPYVDSAVKPYDRITLEITELSAQSYIAHENKRFHAIFDSTIGNRWIDLDPQNYNDGYFRFRIPVKKLDNITIRFGSPLEPITLDRDRVIAEITSYDTTTTFTTLEDHKLEIGDLVYISNFTTYNPTTDSVLINNINQQYGVLVATTPTTTTFTIEIDSSSIREEGTGTIDIANGTKIVTENTASTAFLTFFNVGDYIEIDDVQYEIASIESNTQLTLVNDYAPDDGLDRTNISYFRNNIIESLRPNLYFGAKRIFIPLEIEYLG
jgi:hypothetical protein